MKKVVERGRKTRRKDWRWRSSLNSLNIRASATTDRNAWAHLSFVLGEPAGIFRDGQWVHLPARGFPFPSRTVNLPSDHPRALPPGPPRGPPRVPGGARGVGWPTKPLNPKKTGIPTGAPRRHTLGTGPRTSRTQK